MLTFCLFLHKQIFVPLFTVDTAIAGIRYKGYTDFHGFDTIVISVDDQGTLYSDFEIVGLTRKMTRFLLSPDNVELIHS